MWFIEWIGECTVYCFHARGVSAVRYCFNLGSLGVEWYVRGTVLFIVVCVDRVKAVRYLFELGTKPCKTKNKKKRKRKMLPVVRVDLQPASSLVARA